MNDGHPATAPLSRSDQASQSDRATLAATGWSPVGAEPQRTKRERPGQRASVAHRSPWKGVAQAMSLALALLSALVLMAWVGLGNRPQLVAGASGPVAKPSVVHCSPASAGLVAALQAGLIDHDAGDLRYVSVVQIRSHNNMYFVAATITGTGWDARVGLWATDDPTGRGRIYSVNSSALTDSAWPDGWLTGPHLSDVLDGADVALGCGDG